MFEFLHIIEIFNFINKKKDSTSTLVFEMNMTNMFEYHLEC